LDLPRIMLGTSPFIGAGQFGVKAFEYYSRFYLKPVNMVKLFLKSFELGVCAVQLLSDKPIDALMEASGKAEVKPFVVYSTHLAGDKLRTTLEKLSQLKPEVIALHAEITDRMDVEKIMEHFQVIKDFGSTCGLATHIPGITLPWIEEENVPVEVVLAPLNSLGYAMEPDFNVSMNAIRNCSRKIVAIKPLAAGRLNPSDAFNFIYRYVESIAVGIASEDEMKQTYEAASKAYRERIGGLQVRGYLSNPQFDNSFSVSKSNNPKTFATFLKFSVFCSFL